MINWFWRYRHDRFRQLQHRQALAHMVIGNHWYESKNKRIEGYFSDTRTKTKEVITYFPKIFYRYDDGILQIFVETRMGKYQEQLLNLEKKLEAGLYAELIDKELQEGYMKYTLLYDVIGERISINEVKVENGRLQLMKNVWWEYDALPHMLIIGGTGGGKTYFLLTIIKALLETNAELTVADPKRTAISSLGSVMPNVYSRVDRITEAIHAFYKDMTKRLESFKKLPTYRSGENYAFAGLGPHFFILDEYVTYLEMLGKKEAEIVLSELKQIVLIGREFGFFLIPTCQRPDAKYFSDGMRDQFNFRVALGKVSELGYSMMFGETKKQFFQKPIKGRGYVDTGGSVITEFYTPLVPKGYDFIGEIGAIAERRRQPAQAACEAEAAGAGEGEEGPAAEPPAP